MIQATLSVYPLQQPGYEAVHRAIDTVRSADVDIDEGPMSTIIGGTEQAVFDALRAAFAAAAACGPTVMTVTISNACPAAAK